MDVVKDESEEKLSVPEGMSKVSKSQQETHSAESEETSAFCESIDFTKSVARHTPQSDVNQFEKIFEAWKNHDMCSKEQACDSMKELELAQKNQHSSDCKFNDMKTTNDLLQKTIDSLHTELNLISNVEEDNRNLKEKLQKAELNLKQKENELNVMCKKYEEKIILEKQNHKIETDKLQKAMEIKSDKKINEMQTQIDQNLLELDNLKYKLEETEEQKVKEITALTVEYEDKLAKVQRMKAVSANNQTPTSSNQEIFRKKLQHLKSEYEQETKYLKEQIKGLQSQISGQLNRERASGRQSVSPVSTIAKRPRKF